MTEEQAAMMIELLTEIRDELFRQGYSHRQDGYGQTYVAVDKL